MKAIALALLFLLPLGAQAQDRPAQRQTKAKKLEWIGIGTLAGGVGAAIVGVVSGKQAAFFNTSTPGGTCTYVLAGSSGASVSGTACTVLTGILTSTQTTTTTALTVTIVQHRTTNWKITGPAIAGAGVGAVLLAVGHSHAHTAELSIRPDGVKVAFKW